MTDVRLTATNPEDSSAVPVACNAKGELKLEEPIDNTFDGNLDGDLTVSGDSTITGDTITEKVISKSYVVVEDNLSDSGVYVYGDGQVMASIDRSGNVTFAGNKAGFTAQGNLWCTTVRNNDTVILDTTSNGLGSWASYTPPTSGREILMEVEEWAEKDKSDESQER